MVGRDGRAQPWLARDWTRSADGLSWTIRLRNNALFHDGSPVDSAAVKASLSKTLLSPTRDFSPGLLDIVGIDTPRRDELVVRLASKTAFLLDDLTTSITKVNATGQVVGTGPYLVTSTSADEIVMSAFSNYYGGKPSIQHITWKSYPTARTAWAAMMRGEVDLLYEVAPDAVDFMREKPQFDDFSFLRNYVHGMIFNSSRDAISRSTCAPWLLTTRSTAPPSSIKPSRITASLPSHQFGLNTGLMTMISQHTLTTLARAVAVLEAAGWTLRQSLRGARSARRHGSASRVSFRPICSGSAWRCWSSATCRKSASIWSSKHLALDGIQSADCRPVISTRY